MRRLSVIVICLVANATVVSPANAIMPFSSIECFELSELSLLETKPSSVGGSIVILDPTGVRHRIKMHEPVASDHVTLRVVLSGRVMVSTKKLDINGDWYEIIYDWKINGKPVQRPMPKSFVEAPNKNSVFLWQNHKECLTLRSSGTAQKRAAP